MGSYDCGERGKLQKKRTFTTCDLLPISVSDGIGGRAPSTIFWYSSARRTLTHSSIVSCVSRSRDSISGRPSHAAAFVIAGLCGVGVATFVDADDAALAAPMRASWSIFPARPRSRENHARTLFHDCAPALLEGSSEEVVVVDECGSANTASILGGSGWRRGEEWVGKGERGWGERERVRNEILGA